MVYKFSELFKWTSGKPITPSVGVIPVYGSNGIIGYTDTAKYENKIILGRVGAYCGSVMYCAGKFNATDNTLVTTCDTSKILYVFAYYLLKLYNLNNFAGGAAQPLITQSILKRLKCDIPDVSTQRRIASILSAYDNLIENNNKRIRLLEQMAENLYKEWFVRFRFPGHERAEFENGILKGWKIERYKNIAKISAGGDRPDIFLQFPSKECAVPIYSNGIEKDGLYGFTNKAKIKKPCITISARGTVGFVCLRRIPFVPIVRLLAVVPNESLNVFYLYHSSKYNDLEGNGTSQQQLTVPMLNKRKILIPPTDLLLLFEKTIEPLYNLIDKLKIQTSNLTRQRDLLLPRLMSGKLEVK